MAQTAVEYLIEQMKNGNFESWHTKNKWNISYHAQEKTLEIAKAVDAVAFTYPIPAVPEEPYAPIKLT